MMKLKLRKVLPVLLSVSMVFSMTNPLMTVPLQAAEPTEQTEIPSENGDPEESVDSAISEGDSETDSSVKPSDQGSEQGIQEGQSDSESSTAAPEEQDNGATQSVTEKPALQSKARQEEIRLTVNINDTAYTVSAGQEFSEVVSGQFTSLADITSVEFVSGTVTQDDLGYFKTYKSKLTGLQTLKINLDSDLTFEGGTVLPEGILNVTSGLKSLQTVEIAGFTEIGEDALRIGTLTDVYMPDVVKIGEDAFRNCKKIETLDMPNVITIEKGAFYSCTGLKEVTMDKVESIGSTAFNNISSIVNVRIGTEIPPEVSGTPFQNVKEGSTLTVPDGALPQYLPETEIGAFAQGNSAICWAKSNLQVVDSKYVTLIYKDILKSPVPARYQVLEKGQSIGEEPFTVTKNGYKFGGIFTNENLSEPDGGINSSYIPQQSSTLYFGWDVIKISIANQNGDITESFDLPTNTNGKLGEKYPKLPEEAFYWNTKEDGSGQFITENTKIYNDITLYPIYKEVNNVTVCINDGEKISSANLELTFEKEDIVDTVTKVEILSGKLTQSDYEWMNIGFMKTVERLIIADGVESENKKIPAGTATSAPKLKYLEIHGVEKLEDAAIMSTNLETVILPDVKEIGANALGTFGTSSTTTKMKTVEMPNIERLGNSVFSHQDELTELNFPKLTYIGNSCFNECGALRITVDQIPETGTNPFGSRTSLAKGSVLVVPAGVYDAYVTENGSDAFQGINLKRGAEPTTMNLTIDGRSGYTAASVEEAVQTVIEDETITSVSEVSDITRIRFDGGVIREDDFDYIRENMPKLTTLTIKDGAKITFYDADGQESTKIPDGAFKGLENLENADINEYFTEIGASAFEGTVSLKNLKLGDVSVIGDNAFAIKSGSGNKMTTISSSNVKTIGANAFAGRESLTNVTFRYVESIGEKAFYNLPNLKSFSIYTDLKSIGSKAFAVEAGTETAAFTLYITYSDRTEYTLPEIAADAFENRAAAGGVLDYDHTTDETKISLMDAALRKHFGYDDESNTWFGFQLMEKASVVTAVIDGKEFSGSSLQDAVEKSGIDANDVESIEFVSGTITQEDLKYLKDKTTYLQTLKMNLSESLKLTDSNGMASTVIPGSAFQNTRLETVEIGGFTEIGSMAFQRCTSLKSVSMPNMVTIGQNAFYQTDDYEEIVLPETIKTLNDCGFSSTYNSGDKTLLVTMEGSKPPKITGRVFSGAQSDSYVTVPEGSLANYLPDLDLSKYFGTGGETRWASLRVVDPAYNLITYRGEKNSDTKYAYVEASEKVTEARIPILKKDGFELSGWNTAEDGTGTSLTAETIPTESMTVYAQWEESKANVITVKINGINVSGSDLEDAVAESGIEIKDLKKMEVVSGIVTQNDLDYISQITYLESFTMNLGEGLTMYDKDGTSSTVLGENANVLKFADAPKGWSKPAIRTVVLGGITEIQKGGLTARSAETVSMSDVVTVGKSAFSGMSWLEELNIENAVTVGESAFFNCTRLTDLTMNKVETLGEGSFKNTNSLKRMTLPESIKTIENIEFGVASQGNKNGTRITIKSMTPPEVASGAFKGVASSGGTYSTVTVPHGALAAYVQQINPKADVTKVLNIKDTIWNNLYLREEGSYLVEYSTGKNWQTQFAYVAEGEALTADQIAGCEVEGKILTGWNTAEDGTGDMLTVGTVLTEDIKVYPVLKDAVTLIVHVGEDVTEIPVVKDEAIGDRLPADPVMEGHIFKGWNTVADGSGTAVTADTVAEDNIEIYAVFEKEPVILSDIASVTAENGKITITLKDKPTQAPSEEDISIQMNLNDSGNKDIKIKDFTYDGDKTIVLIIDEIVKTDAQQKFTVTVTMEGKSVTSNEVIVEALGNGEEPEQTPGADGTNKPQDNNASGSKDNKTSAVKTGDEAKTIPFAAAGIAAIAVIAGVAVWKKKRMV